MAVSGLRHAGHRTVAGVTAPDREVPSADAEAPVESATIGTGSAIALGCTLLSVILLVVAILIILAVERF